MDPYKVLGVSPDDDEETIKKAYKELVKKYHPDKYVNSPLADVASEKMKEINQAYDMITKGDKTGTENRQQSYGGYNTGGYNTGGYNTGGYNTGGYNTGGYGGTSFATVRMLIQLNRLAQAEQMLNRLQKTAEWYYLYGVICMRRGWYDRAVENIRTAVNMDPDNVEYRSALNNIENGNTEYRQNTYGTNGMNCCGMPCDCCTLCLCAQCCNPSPCC